MFKQLPIARALAVSVLALLFSACAQAGASRTFVSTTGNDASTTANCGNTTPCRSFDAALSVTNSGGEVVVLNSGGYGPATISQPVIITAIGVDASVSVTTTGADGLTINTSGNVTINGLNLHGEAAGTHGVEVVAVGFLRLYNLLIENFTPNGVDFGAVGGRLAIYNSIINDNGAAGLDVHGESATAFVRGSSFDNDNIGVSVDAFGAKVSVADSSVVANEEAFQALAGIMSLIKVEAVFNGTALIAEGGEIIFADCLIAGNGTSYDVNSGSLSGTNPGSSLISTEQITSGTLGTPIVLK